MSDDIQGQVPAPAATSPQPAALPDGSQPAAGGATSAPAAADPGAVAKPDDGVQRRIDELTGKFRNAERDAAYWREQALKGQPQPPPVAPVDEKPKTLEDFEYDASRYTEYLVGLATKKATDEAEKRLRQQSEQEQVQRRQSEYRSREETFAKDLPDYLEVTRAPSLPINQVMADAIAASEDGPAILYHLGKNTSVADSIARLPPLAAAVEIGRISERLAVARAKAAEAKPKVSEAPPPTPKLEGSDPGVQGKPDTSESDALSDSEWTRRRNLQLARRKA